MHVVLWEMLGLICVLGGVVVTVFGVMSLWWNWKSVHAVLWEMLGLICVPGGVVVTVFGVDESVVELEECACGVVGKCLAFLCAWRSCNSGVDESMVELEEHVGHDVVLWEMLSLCVCMEELL